MTAITAAANSGKRYEFYSAFFAVITCGAFYVIYAGMSALGQKQT
jgi:hypothetical protein